VAASTVPILFAREGAEPCLSWEVCRCAEAGLSAGPAVIAGLPPAPLTEAPAFHAFLRRLFRHDWVVYAKPPFGGPVHVRHHLARYTHRVAISNHRIVNVTEDQVTFRWKDYAHGRDTADDGQRDGISPSILFARAATELCPHAYFGTY
jgi:hypothetical protein